jgi:tetratricopeptide (TPR) repeat protein
MLLRGLLFFSLCLGAFAHGPAHERIAALTKDLEQRPQDAALWLARGQAYAGDGDAKAALADFDRAAACDPGLADVELARGETLSASGDGPGAVAAFTRFVGRRPDFAPGYVARARAWVRQEKFPEAAADFAEAIARAPAPEPTWYLEQARAFQRSGKPAEARSALEAGQARLGPLVTLVVPLLQLEVEAGEIDHALTRLEKFTASQSRKERWLSLRGEILEGASRKTEARAAFLAAQAALATLPEDRRQTVQMLDLASEIDAALARLPER